MQILTLWVSTVVSQLTELRSISAACHGAPLNPAPDNNRPRDKNECHQAFPPLANQLGLSTGPVQHKASSELLGPAIQAANPSFVPELSAGSPQCPTADLPDEEILAVKAAADESRILVRVMVLATLFAPAEEILPQVIAPLTAVSSTSWIVERP